MLNKSARRKPRFKLSVKRQTKPRKILEPRTVIVSFRLRKSEADLLSKNLKTGSMAGVRSLKQFCRKLAIDHAYGRTVYVQNVDREIDPDGRDLARKVMGIGPPDCQMDDTRFIQALESFLSRDENWQKLRFFMLQAGWPDHLVREYHEADSPNKRLRVAKTYLEQMVSEAKRKGN